MAYCLSIKSGLFTPICGITEGEEGNIWFEIKQLAYILGKEKTS